MAKPAEATLGDISLNRLAVYECSDFNVCFVLEPFDVSDGPMNLHVERAYPATQANGNWPALRAVEEDGEYRSLIYAELGFWRHSSIGVAPEWLLE